MFVIVKSSIPLPSPFPASEKRQLEFAAGRRCAQQALEKLHLSGEVGVGAKREPVWPQGAVGSIAHTFSRGEEGWAGAVVGYASAYRSLGFDMEAVLSDKRAQNLQHRIFCPGEAERLKGEMRLGLLTTIVFSAKESLYKALFPLVREFFDFHDAEVLTLDGPQFKIALRRDLGEFTAGSAFDGRYWLEGKLVHTMVSL